MARTDLEQLVYQMSADVRQLEAANKRALASVNSSTRAMQGRYDRLAAEMGRDFGKVSLAAGVAFGAIAGYATKAASDAAETANAFQVAFGALEGQASKFARSYSSEVGRALDETQASMARTQLVLTGVGVAAEQALSMTEQIQRRAIDIGSLWNVSDAEAYQAILSGIAGEAEPLKKFGVAVNEAATKAELLKLGFKGNAEQAPEAAKAIARLNIILRQSASADGDAIRTKDGLANSTKRAQAEFRNAAVELGQNFLPTATAATHAAAELLGEFNDMPDSIKLAGLAFLGLVAAGGPITMVIDGLVKVIKYAGMARVAMTTVAGGAGLAVGAVTVGYAAVGLSAYNNAKYRGTLKGLGGASAEDLSAAQAYAQKNVSNYAAKPDSQNAGRSNQLLAQYRTELKAIQDEIARRATQAEGAANAQIAAAGAAAQQSFGLSGSQLNPVAGSTGAKGKTAAQKAAELALRQRDAFETDLARAQDQELSARQQMALSIRERAQIDLDRLAADRAAREAELKTDVEQKRLTAAQAKTIAAAEEKARATEEAAIIAQRDRDLEAHRLDMVQALIDAQVQTLEYDTAAARTTLQRLAIEERILALRQQAERNALEQSLRNDPNASAADRGTRREALGAMQAAAKIDLRRTAAMELKGGILDAFEAARGGAASFAQYLSDHLRAKLMDRLADLFANMLLTRAEGGGFLGGVAKMFAGFFAGGGTIPAGQWGIVNDGGVEAVRAKPGGGVEVASNARLRAMVNPPRAVDRSPSVVQVHQVLSLDLSGAVMTPDLINQLNAQAKAMAMQAYGQAVKTSQRSMPAEQQRLALLGKGS